MCYHLQVQQPDEMAVDADADADAGAALPKALEDMLSYKDIRAKQVTILYSSLYYSMNVGYC